MRGKWTRTVFMLWPILLIFPAQVSGLEPATALDDAFTIPTASRIAESSMLFPGAESFAVRAFALVAQRVPFGVEELSVTSAHAGMSGKRFGMSVSYSSSGFDLYGEEAGKAGLSFAPFESVGAGIRLTRNALRIKGFGDASAWSADAGLVIRPHDRVFLAVSVEDVVGAELGESDEPLDGGTRFAASWAAAGNVDIIGSFTKIRRLDPAIVAGFTAVLFDVLTLGAAGGTEPDRFEYLTGVAVSGVRASYRGSWHTDLGMTHGFCLCWGGGKAVRP